MQYFFKAFLLVKKYFLNEEEKTEFKINFTSRAKLKILETLNNSAKIQ